MVSIFDKALGNLRARSEVTVPTVDVPLSHDSDFGAFVDAATGVRGDLRQDRIVDVYRMLRHTMSSATWHHSEPLRKFISDTQDENPYIPAMIRARELVSRSNTVSPRKFKPAWIAAGSAHESLEINAEQLESTMTVAPEIIDAFKRSNVHDTSYFFTKLAEWLITLMRVEELGATNIVDLGAAYHGFSEVATRNHADLTVSMVDLAFPAGRNNFQPRIDQIGSDAGNLDMIESGSIDLVCAHNAFEHFSGDSDTRCIREVERILKPGGRMLISPIFADEIYSLSINPFACFVVNDTNRLADDISDELKTKRVRVDFRPNIISPYSRRYDIDALQERVLSQVPSLTPVLLTPQFAPDGFENHVYHRDILGMKLDQRIFDRRVFHCLELVKHG